MQPNKYNIAIIGNAKPSLDAIGDLTMKDISLVESHELTSTNILNSTSQEHSYVYGPINKGLVGEEDKIIRCQSKVGTHEFGLEIVLERRNYLHNYKTKYYVGEQITLRGFTKAIQYNRAHTIAEINVSADGEDLITLLTQFSMDDTGCCRSSIQKLYCEDISFTWNIQKLLKRCFLDAGYQVSSAFMDSYFFKNKYALTPDFKRSPEWMALNSGRIGLTNAQHATAGLYQIPWDTLISGNSTHFDLVNHVLVAREHIHLILNLSLFYDVIYDSVPGTVKFYFLYRPTPTAGWQARDEYIGRVIKKNSYTILGNYSQRLEQEVEIRLIPGEQLMINVDYGDRSGTDTLTIYPDMSYIDIIAQPTIIKGATVHVNDVMPSWKQIDFIRAIRHLYNLKFITDDFKKIVYIEPRDSFYNSNIVDWSDKMDISSEIMIEELGSDMNRTSRLSYLIDNMDAYDKSYKDSHGNGWASEAKTIDNLFAQEGETDVINPIFAATQMDFHRHIGLIHARLPILWKDLKEDQTVPDTFTDFTPRILSLYPVRYCTLGDSWTLEGVVQYQYPYFYFYDGSIDDNLCFNDIPGIGHGMRGLLSKHYGNFFRTTNLSRKITAFFTLNANDLQSFITPDERALDFRAKYILRMNNETVHCRLSFISDYRPGENIPTKCILITDNDLPTIAINNQVHEVTFKNNDNNLGSGDSHANGCIQCFGRDWGLVRASAMGNIISGGTSTKYGVGAFFNVVNMAEMYYIERGFLYFDTSTLPDTCSIIEAKLHIRKEAGSPEMEIALFQGTQSNLLTRSDFNKFGTVQFGETTPGILGSRYIQLNAAGLASINKTGWTKFALREKHYDLVNIEPTHTFSTFKTLWSSAPTGREIYLTVKYRT